MELYGQSTLTCRLKYTLCLLQSKSDSVTEGVNSSCQTLVSHFRKDLVTYKINIGIASAFKFRGQGMGTEICGYGRNWKALTQQSGHSQHSNFCLKIQPIPRLYLHSGHPFGHKGLEPGNSLLE